MLNLLYPIKPRNQSKDTRTNDFRNNIHGAIFRHQAHISKEHSTEALSRRISNILYLNGSQLGPQKAIEYDGNRKIENSSTYFSTDIALLSLM